MVVYGHRIKPSDRLSQERRFHGYKVPRRVLSLREDELAMTGSDKVKAGALRQLAVERLGGTPSAS